jgi:hypothetical protein
MQEMVQYKEMKILLSYHNTREGDLIPCNSLFRMLEERSVWEERGHYDIFSREETSFTTAGGNIREFEPSFFEYFE